MGGVNENKVEESSLTVLVAEASRTSGATSATSASAGSRHFDGSNFAFVDGHVKWFKSPSATQATFTVPGTTIPPVACGPTEYNFGAGCTEVGADNTTSMNTHNNPTFNWVGAGSKCPKTAMCAAPNTGSANFAFDPDASFNAYLYHATSAGTRIINGIDYVFNQPIPTTSGKVFAIRVENDADFQTFWFVVS